MSNDMTLINRQKADAWPMDDKKKNNHRTKCFASAALKPSALMNINFTNFRREKERERESAVECVGASILKIMLMIQKCHPEQTICLH